MSQPAQREPAASVPDPVGAVAAEQTSALARTAVALWANESRSFLEGMARDGAQALQDLGACRTPWQAVAVEQKWLTARTCACIDAGFRIMTGIFLEPEEAVGEAAKFRLPD